MDDSSKLSLEPFTKRDIIMILYESIKRGEFDLTMSCVQEILKAIENPEYRKINPEYTKDNIQALVTKYTILFRAFLVEKESIAERTKQISQ